VSHAEPATSPSAETTMAPADRPAPAPSPWLWMVIGCLIVAASGAIRVYQERQFDQAAQQVQAPPFPLEELPKKLVPPESFSEQVGTWQMTAQQELDAKTLEVAGSTGYIARTYSNDDTGVELSALVVFGPAFEIYGHAPPVCFPAFGYNLSRAGRTVNVETSNGPVSFQSMGYAKPAGGSTEYVEVFYTFWHAGRWAPDASTTRKQFRHQPAMFKIQVQRPISKTEQNAEQSPAESFLAALVPAIEARMAEAWSETETEPSIRSATD